MSREFAALLVLCASCTSQPEYVRVVDEDDRGRLEVAWVELEPPAGRPPVWLINSVHVADLQFFVSVQDRLDSAPVVLIEGIVRDVDSHGGVTEPSPALFTGSRIGSGLLVLARQLDLVYQNDALQIRNHWQKADMTESEFRALMGGSMASRTHTVARPASRIPALARSRRELAESIEQSAADPPRRPVVVQARNRIALRALAACSPDETVALCWGYAHAADFVRSLTARGYRVASREWRVVFRY